MSNLQEGAGLFVIATPIGNLGDITLRAIEILKNVNVIFAEDTRVTRILLEKFEIKDKRLESLNARNERSKTEQVLRALENGQKIALVSDAGTPIISDPGGFLVSTVREAGYVVVPIPGASAVTTALSASGLPSSEFLFLGFLPHKKGREKKFLEIEGSERTVVFFESPHRIIRSLERLSDMETSKKVVVARELTKIYEEFVSGSPQETLSYFKLNPQTVKGEFVVMVASVWNQRSSQSEPR